MVMFGEVSKPTPTPLVRTVGVVQPFDILGDLTGVQAGPFGLQQLEEGRKGVENPEAGLGVRPADTFSKAVEDLVPVPVLVVEITTVPARAGGSDAGDVDVPIADNRGLLGLTEEHQAGQ